MSRDSQLITGGVLLGMAMAYLATMLIGPPVEEKLPIAIAGLLFWAVIVIMYALNREDK